ncbi:hypothetical protein [Acinetobacter bereziniae]|uniref:hypothetical protein n=1 Tax=Acinetobacter bereziniae TaxID=106648 RepID=UPI003570CF14
MGLASFNRMRREAAEREAKSAEQEQTIDKPVDKMNVKELREKLVSLGVNPEDSAKKPELIGLLESALNLDSHGNQNAEDVQGKQADESAEQE